MAIQETEKALEKLAKHARSRIARCSGGEDMATGAGQNTQENQAGTAQLQPPVGGVMATGAGQNTQEN